MVAYIIVILFLFISWRKAYYINDINAKAAFEKQQMWIYVAILAFLAAVKFIFPNTDMEGYMGDYNRLFKMSFVDAYYRSPDNQGYYLISKVFSLTHLTYHYWFAFVEAMYFGSLVLLIDRFSQDKLYSLLLSFTISVFYFTLCGSKQTLSMAFTVFSLLAVVDKKYITGIILFGLAYFCHHSSLIFSIVFFIYFFKDRNWFWPVTLVFGSAIVFGGGFLLQTTLSIMSSDHYSSRYSDNSAIMSYTVLLYYAVVFMFAYFYRQEYSKVSKFECRFFVSLSLFCVVAQSLVGINSDFFRLAYFFIPFMIILPANSFSFYNKGYSYKLMLAVVTIFFMLYTSRNGGYQFMWQ